MILNLSRIEPNVLIIKNESNNDTKKTGSDIPALKYEGGVL